MSELIAVEVNAQTGVVTQRPFTQAEIDEYNAANQPVIPTIVTMRQARLALLQSGYLDSINNYMATNAGAAAKIEWEYAAEVDRNSPLVANLATMLSLSNQQLDGLFTLAASL